ncbi:UDP-N-acetylglucosamine 2-epimerase (non-hydrolyzing) [Desulfobacter hydrogenophilus]|uniref:UDP-N-acetylglucosamine 2-epimerase (Non-hydrolyzing) n=1 Tax=Desulfobacter hydrogenophilus TaxID=2291 RepID=A0A328FBH6_9BACT|nr:UDP-N-acetylglucosamine 2-epimerase (non-hydrolyzing) [Desulfobacter hydrogenophilus]NDY74108.1 UDP-N-acetylglucosamine 2-epimerase (non-hydrolyzing) [Desulfobacter hydrogenophilus]QBH14088.1 UDP-N-acetylglucosamine 2-epimerase (non-hydrolyzing) [Desulfobacter hydrogenophilus]RAM01649.1 UDP-N-acetylglucosamine 2-epimerase (non-hydrolyzing) [Desulfobacter hydrogenophilus]
MPDTIKISTIIGARPQFIKAATVSRAISVHNAAIPRSVSGPLLHETIIHTGQHFDANMSEVFFRELEIPAPDYNLGIGGGSHGRNTGRMIEAIEDVLLKETPDWVLVYGDTDSTLAGALAAAKLHIPVAHVEAGLRSYNRAMPEEINRILTDQLSTILFCPTRTAEANLAKEGFPHRLSSDTVQQICNVGDVMYDAALFYAVKAEKHSRIMQTLGLTPKGFVLATIHRAENTDYPERLAAIMAALEQIAKEIPVVLPLHPRTRKCLENMGGACNDPQNSPVRFVDPVGYLDMVMLEKNARVIITDSGGVQKEAYFHGVPCVTVREETEWVELVEAGVNVLAGSDTQHVVQAFQQLINKFFVTDMLYGNGNSAEKIVDILNT